MSGNFESRGTGMVNQRTLELLDCAAMEGIKLPLPVEDIVALEDAGHVVDLRTGEVIEDGATLRFEPTVIGEAMMVVWEAEDEGNENFLA